MLREGNERGDTNQATYQQDNERADGTPCLSRGETIGQTCRHSKRL